MTGSLISEVASLWTLGLVIFLTVVVVMFRRQLKDLLHRGGVQVRRGNVEVVIAARDETPVGAEVSPPEIEVAEAAGGLADLPRLTEGTAPATSDDGSPEDALLGRLYSRLQAHDQAEARRIFDELQGLEPDPVERQRNELIFLYGRFIVSGDSRALSELEEHAAGGLHRAFAHRLIAESNEQSGYYERALASYRRSVEVADREDDRAVARLGEARMLVAVGRSLEAISVLSSALADTRDLGERQRCYDQLAAAFAAQAEWLLQALALEKALELTPSDATRRFNIGYAYANAGLPELALLHYKAAIQGDPVPLHAHNNLGATFERLGMPIRAVRHYRCAGDAGEAVGVANLAARLISAGFAEEATELLREASQIKDAHQSVAENLARAMQADQVESQTELATLQVARARQEFFNSFAEAMLVQADVGLPSRSRWSFSDGTRVTLQYTEQGLRVSYSREGRRYAMKGEVQNRAFLLDITTSGGQAVDGSGSAESPVALGVIRDDRSIELLLIEADGTEVVEFLTRLRSQARRAVGAK